MSWYTYHDVRVTARPEMFNQPEAENGKTARIMDQNRCFRMLPGCQSTQMVLPLLNALFWPWFRQMTLIKMIKYMDYVQHMQQWKMFRAFSNCTWSCVCQKDFDVSKSMWTEMSTVDTASAGRRVWNLGTPMQYNANMHTNTTILWQLWRERERRLPSS